MVWASTSPDGTQSVKANVPIQQQNTTYIETTMGNVLSNAEPSQDHFWNLDPSSGHHRQVQMKQYSSTYTGAPADPSLAGSFDGSLYLKSVNGTVQGFYKNAAGIYQFIPGYLTGAVALNTNYVDVVTVPDNCYGLVWIFRGSGDFEMGFGSFKADGGKCQGYCCPSNLGNSSSANLALRFANGNLATNLKLRAKTDGANPGLYNYKVIYWAQ